MKKINFKYFETERLLLLLIAVALLIEYLFSFLIEPTVNALNDPWRGIFTFTERLGVPSLIGFFFWFINKWAWEWGCFKWLIDIPNLNGRYVGKLISSYELDGSPVEKDCVLEIKQNASSIHVFAYFGNEGETSSNSESVSEELIQGKNGMFELYYVFHNQTGSLQDKLNNHSGTARFNYYADIQSLHGDYYNQLKNTGRIKVKFSQKVLMGRFS